MKYLLLLSLGFFTLLASDAFITPSELKNSLKDKNIIIIDVADDTIYKTSHIKGAINSDVTKFINQDPQNIYSLMNSPEIIQKELRLLGINQDSKVIIYSHNTNKGVLHSSYLAFILLFSGFDNITILDGGYMAWIFEHELLTSSIVPDAKDIGNIVVKPNKYLLVSRDKVQDNLASTLMLDARSSQMYYGTERSEKVASIGHISYSKSSFYKDKFLRDGLLRDQSELDEIYIYGYGLKSSDHVIVYADNALNASMEFYILYKHMGFKNTKLYEASLLEWGNALNLPMTRFKWE
ncbi:thiosulfate sulfurtransferase [Sulfurimonas gotlandica GD1]|uniref:Thiosulfate sulfurtransferase n=1 Tax=Sulfurimonas gotlandica (strain DSM 19862 / JCM 16533 / GD1) TaxID=929558 RepID=B6BLT5_SULGG|nr:rhodanese-like domain-containing protein [Sulfurimonas gotlandica]EDZ61739.1 thiosulfate sulfurtransferase, putative [Sulfurimonas gotlandica GD1]EHP29493.1 thiosulfate sulfurtransferase [Sulfurimonas gotlandica GD1]